MKYYIIFAVLILIAMISGTTYGQNLANKKCIDKGGDYAIGVCFTKGIIIK